SDVTVGATLREHFLGETGYERGPAGTVYGLCRGTGRGDRACRSGGAVARLLPGLAAAGRAQERRADRGGNGAGAGLGQAPVVAAFRRQRAMVERAGSQPDPGADPAAHRRQRRDRSLDHRRHRVSEEGPSLGRGGPSILRPARQAGQLSGRGQPVCGQSCSEPADRLATVPAAGVGGRCRAPRRCRHPRDDRVSDQAGDCAGADPGGVRRRSAAGRCTDGCRVWHQHVAARGDQHSGTELCRRHPAAEFGVAAGDGTAAATALVGLRAAHRDEWRTEPREEEWLLIEWPEGEAEPAKYWLTTLPPDIPFERLVDLAKLRWRIERDYQELKQELGLGHYEGRGWRGFHHHATLCVAAYAFLIAERARISPSTTGSPADQFAASEVSQNRQPRGPARPPRTTCCQLDRDNAPTPDRRPRNHPGTMSVLQHTAQNHPRHSNSMTQ